MSKFPVNIEDILKYLSFCVDRHYDNADSYFKNIMTPMRVDALAYSQQYLILFDNLTIDEELSQENIEKLIDQISIYRNDKIDAREEYFMLIRSMKKSLDRKIMRGLFRKHAKTFFTCLLGVFLGQATNSANVGTPYTSLISYLKHSYFVDNNDDMEEKCRQTLKEYCEWNINNQKTHMENADQAYSAFQAELARI